MKTIKRIICASTLSAMCFCLFGCNSESEFTFEDISFEMNTDYELKENEDDGVEDIYTVKSSTITLNDKNNTYINISCTEYYDYGSKSSEEQLNEAIERKDSMQYAYTDDKSIIINDIEMQNDKHISARGVDPLNCEYIETYYFVYENKLYELRTSSHNSVGKDDFTDSYKQEKFEEEQFKLLKQIIETVEIK